MRLWLGFVINQTTMPTLLAIETSCDETGVALLTKAGEGVTVLSSAVASQVDVHALTGGVVPEVAAREHLSVINPLIEKVLDESVVSSQLSVARDAIDAIAVTVGPGLIPALVVGVQTARTLACAWNTPIVPVHHIEGHIVSALLSGNEMTNDHFPIPNDDVFPALALIVSGGHTMLIKVAGHLQYEVLGQTRDDAAGEAFDKVARLLELPYPGGPSLSKLAEQGDPAAFAFARPMQHSGDLDFSFSGLKTEVLYKVREREGPGMGFRADIAASFQQAVVDSLTGKARQALRQDSYQTLLLAGGVAANQLLREEMTTLAKAENITLRIAPLELCGDNGVMIGQAGLFAYEAGRLTDWKSLDASARLSITSL